MSINSNNTITVQVLVNADLQTAWDRYTNPEYITKWNFASDDWECPNASNDIRTGGNFSSTMRAKDGSASFDFGGVYDEVVPLKSINYHMDDSRKVAITFEEVDGGVKVTTIFDPETQNPLEMQEGGWQAILDNYKKCVDSK
jgi:uncharacterized protein YndB with AHSA1/START domain